MKKNREEFLMEGARGVHAILESPIEIVAVYLAGELEKDADSRLGLITNLAEKRGVAIRRIGAKEWRRLRSGLGAGATKTPPGIAAVAFVPAPAPIEQMLGSSKRLVILDGVSDPGNAGALVRSAYLLGWDGVLLTEGSVSLFGPKTARASAGAVAFLPWLTTGASEISLALARNGFTVLVAEPGGGGSNFADAAKLALVLGNEAFGPRSLWPGAGRISVAIRKSPIDSLGVAQSGAMLLGMLRSGR